MDELNLCGAPPEKKCRTTDSRHALPRYKNLMKHLDIVRPDQVWVADITYIRLHREFVYLGVIMDVFTRRIRGWHLRRSIDQGLTLAALERALVMATLRGLGVQASMAAVGEPRENGYAERLMRTIKEEEVDLSEYRDIEDARQQIGRFLDDVYNVKRIHSSLRYLTPVEFAAQWRATPQPATTTSTGAEDRATLGSDPSAASRAKSDPGRHDADLFGSDLARMR
jgi:transposase InsO family protein